MRKRGGWSVGPGLSITQRTVDYRGHRRHPGTFNELYGVHFTDSNHGWIVGQFGEILHTKDGGQTWRFQPSGVEENLNKIYLADTLHGIIVGDKGIILTTTNGGAKWEKQEKRHGERSLGILLLTRGNGRSRTRRNSDAIFD